MTPKEKAKELFEKFRIHSPVWEVKDDAKQCALIAVDELLEFENRVIEEWRNYFEGKGGSMKVERIFWEEVKHEIENL
jgi:hypothetical protein